MYSVIILVTAGLTNLNFLDLVNAQGNLTEGLEPCAVSRLSLLPFALL